MKKKFQKKIRRKHSTDELASKLWFSLREDFASLLEYPDFRRDDAQLLRNAIEGNFKPSDIKAFRDSTDRPVTYLPKDWFKASVQLSALLKKYRFRRDVYTDEELESRTLKGYFDNQIRLATPATMGPLGALVCKRARKIIREILGKYSPVDTEINAKFGKKSSIGCPFALAYIDFKLTNVAAFTGSSACAEWFEKNILTQDAILKRMVDRLPVKFTGCDERLQHTSLKLVNVPKTWKVDRTITPLSLLALFYSYGVGWQVTERLKEHGLDIRKLQNVHRKLIKRFSTSLSHATVDLSAASDSITSELLNRCLPREWYVAIKKAMTHTVEHNGVSSYTESVLPMGNGFTFPVETLIFYALIKAIGTLTNVKGIFSVYGDDLIYPSKLHKYVVGVFPQLKLQLNLDKTFVNFPFRESCGEDFYRGMAVRPYYLSGTGQNLNDLAYQSHLYKIYNGLLRRWSEHEIPQTLNLLLIELSLVAGEVYRVPPSYPDTAGIKVDDIYHLPRDNHWVPWSPVNVMFTAGSRWYTFKFLYTTMKSRVILTQEPYYWLALQGRNDDPDSLSPNFWETDYSYYHQAPRPPIHWKSLKRIRWYTKKGKRVQKVIRSKVPHVSSRDVLKIEAKQVSAPSLELNTGYSQDLQHKLDRDVRPNDDCCSISDWI